MAPIKSTNADLDLLDSEEMDEYEWECIGDEYPCGDSWE